MRKRILLAILLILVAMPLAVSAHSGRTDSNGGHTDHSTGEYHYHHGYPAHNHYDMDGDGDLDCPYEFDDKTNHGNSNSGDSNIDFDFDDLTVPTFNTDKFTIPSTESNRVSKEENNADKSNSSGEDIALTIIAFVLIGGIWISPIFFRKK